MLIVLLVASKLYGALRLTIIIVGGLLLENVAVPAVTVNSRPILIRREQLIMSGGVKEQRYQDIGDELWHWVIRK